MNIHYWVLNNISFYFNSHLNCASCWNSVHEIVLPSWPNKDMGIAELPDFLQKIVFQCLRLLGWTSRCIQFVSGNFSIFAPLSSRLHPGKPTWQRKTNHFKMYLLLKLVIFQCHVSCREGNFHFTKACKGLCLSGKNIASLGSFTDLMDLAGLAPRFKLIHRSPCWCAICYICLPLPQSFPL